MDEHRLRREIAKGYEAQSLLEHPLLVDCFTGLKRRYQDVWLGAQEAEQREQCWHDMQALLRLEAQLQEWVISAEMAAQQQQEREARNERG
ncbi:hypothetical protein GC177_05310 [bacterium]|nr:hypothetical protein [bacterium]